MSDFLKLHRRERKLAQYYGLSTRQEFLAKQVFEGTKPTSQGREKFHASIGAVIEGLLKLQSSGGYFISDIISVLKKYSANAVGSELAPNIGKDLDTVISHIITAPGLKEDVTKTGIRFGNIEDAMSASMKGKLAKKTPGRSSKDRKMASSILVVDPRIGPGSYNTNIVSLFMNAIPTLEMAKSVPFIKLEVLSPRPPVT